MAEGDWDDGLRANPAIRDDADEVLGREGLGDRHKELDVVLFSRKLALEEEEFMVEDLLSITVLKCADSTIIREKV